MKRVIKYRFWDSGLKEMIYQSPSIVIRLGGKVTDGGIALDGELLEFTGLTDMDGKEVYDGDILENVKYGHTFQIIWGIPNDSYAGWAGDWIKGREKQTFISPMYNEPFQNCRIIGNIYENPELLLTDKPEVDIIST